MKGLISQKINVLNQATLRVMAEESNLSIIKNFTDESVKILEADFGFAWGKFNDTDTYKLTYKSPDTPYNPTIPKRKSKKSVNYRNHNLIFDINVKKGNYEPDLSQYLKSYIIIPISYGDHIYGSIVICYKKPHNFTDEELALAEAVGNTIAQAITINWVVEKEQKALTLAEKQKETEILLAQEKIKTEFIANATHELRTPLAIISGNVDLALSGGQKKSLKSKESALKAIKGEVAHLSSILVDLSLLISPHKNKDIITAVPLNLLKFIKETVERVKVLSGKKGISVKVINSPNVFISGDEKYLEKLFLNILKNGITYGRKHGKITIEVQKKPRKALVIIKDDGIGIPKEDLPHVFERFFRVDKSHSSYGKHSGLGLAIAKWIVEMHGGSIEVESTYGKGATFLITLPVIKKL